MQKQNARGKIFVTDGIDMLSNASAFTNAPWGITVIPSGILIVFKALLNAKAYAPILFTVAGRVIEVICSLPITLVLQALKPRSVHWAIKE